MRYAKFKLLFVFLISYGVSANGAFGDLDCISSSFKALVSHPSAPFGLAAKNLSLNKSQCVIVLEHETYKFIKKKWEIDVCRTPVHIKYGTGEVEVFKRLEMCTDRPKKDDLYCPQVKELLTLIQDDGLIFAKGEKEDLNSVHGKVFCSFVLVKKYLEDGYVFTRHAAPSFPLTPWSTVGTPEIKN